MTLLLLVALAAPMGQGLQAQAPAASASVEVERKPEVSNGSEPEDLPISLARIQRKLSRPPAIRLQGERVVFRVEVLGRKPSIEDILGPDYLKGPVPYGSMTHQEFLDIVTPKDVQGYAAFSN